MGHVFGPIDSRNDNRTGAIGFQTTIVEAKRLGNPARSVIGFGIERPTISEGAGVQLRVPMAGQCDSRHRIRAYPV